MKKITVLLIILLGLVVFTYYYEIEGEKKRREAKALEESLFRMQEEAITSVEVLRPGQERIVLKKEGENWMMREPVETSADQTTVDSLLRNIDSAHIDRTFPADAQAGDKYGLKEPKLTLKVRSEDEETVLWIGNDDYTGSQVYVQFDGKPQVHLTSDYLLTTVDKDLMGFRNKKVLGFERDKVRMVEILRPAGAIRLKKTAEKWSLELPVQEPAEASTVNSLLSALEFAEAQKFVAEQSDKLKSYGLGKPEVVARIQEEGQDSWKILQLGRKQEDGYLARNPEQSPIFTVKGDLYQELTQDVWEFRDKDVVDVAQDRVARLLIRRDGQEIILKQEDIKWIVEKPDSQKGKEALSYKFWYPIDEILFESIAEATPVPDFPRPDIQVVLTLKDGSSRSFDFAQKKGTYLARKVETNRQGTISKESFEKLQFKVEEIVAA